MFTFLGLMLVAGIIGYIEQLVMRGGFVSPEPRICNKFFSLPYHIPYFIAWALIPILAGQAWAIGLFFLVEDVAWYIFHPDKKLGPNEWNTFGFGGFTIPGTDQFIPWSYLGGPILSLLLLILI